MPLCYYERHDNVTRECIAKFEAWKPLDVCIASSPGSSQLFNVARCFHGATLKSWEEPRDKACVCVSCTYICACVCCVCDGVRYIRINIDVRMHNVLRQ